MTTVTPATEPTDLWSNNRRLC